MSAPDPLAVLAAISYTPLVRIHIGPLAISPHGIGTALGFALGALLLYPRARKRGIAEDWIGPALTRAMIGALIGARVAFVVNNLHTFDSPIEWFQVWNGGISLLGGITGALIANRRHFRRGGYRFFQVMDAVVPGLAVGIAVGRIGDLVIADHLGARTTLPFGFQCPDVVDVGRTVGSRCPPGAVVHLTAAYDLISVSLVLALVLYLERRRLREGTLAIAAALAYAIGRFSFDFLREDARHLGLTGSQLFALTIAIAATTALLRRRRQPQPADDTVSMVA